jgi:hypothetical protein
VPAATTFAERIPFPQKSRIPTRSNRAILETHCSS